MKLLSQKTWDGLNLRGRRLGLKLDHSKFSELKVYLKISNIFEIYYIVFSNTNITIYSFKIKKIFL